jgi:hypothetical protein
MKLLILLIKLTESFFIMVVVLPLMILWCVPSLLRFLAGLQDQDLNISEEHKDFIVYRNNAA